ncbi:hypothetical protein JTB14_012162 [Gonioctena quinquepunctata]|nr:hypothetical protein JTB14_012162 [Gonioctena quinquepunctata]
MVRTYKRKTQKEVGYRYSEEALQQAIEDVRNPNKTIRGASITYGVPRTTIKHYIRETRGKGKQGGSVKSYLTEQKELELAECIREMEKNGFGLSRQAVMDLVERYIVLVCCSAEGKMYRFFVYLSENTSWKTGSASQKLFYNWFKKVFLPNIGPERPVLLIYDGHVTHISTKLIRLAIENRVGILKLPPTPHNFYNL